MDLRQALAKSLEIDLCRVRVIGSSCRDNEKNNHYRHEVLQFLYERQRRPGEEKAATEQVEESSQDIECC